VRRRLQHELFALADTGPGDQKLPMACADIEVSYLDFLRQGLCFFQLPVRSSNQSCSEAAGESKPEAYLSHPPTPELPRQLVPRVGNVEDFDDPRTKLQAGFSISTKART